MLKSLAKVIDGVENRELCSLQDIVKLYLDKALDDLP